MKTNKIDKFLRAFSDEIREVMSFAPIQQNNVVITGSNVLDLHGLNVSWETQDLDVAVYNPTEEQIYLVTGWVGDLFKDDSYFKKFMSENPSLNYEACMSYEEAEEKNIRQRAWKKTKVINGKEIMMNFILEYNQPFPNPNLSYRLDNILYQVQDINTIIDAKLSYGSGQDKSFLRRKDAYHLSELRSNNFIIPIFK